MARYITFLTNIKSLYRQNPLMAISVLWVMVVPALGSMLLVSYAYHHQEIPNMVQPGLYLLLILAGTMMMGLALCPTTILAILAGYWWGWPALPAVTIAYSLASLLGYFVGLTLDKNSFEILLDNYPKAKAIVHKKGSEMGSLIFFTRISPVIPFALSNILFAMIKAGWKNILLYGFFGMLPRTLMAFGLGLAASSLTEALDNRTDTAQLLLFMVLLAVSIWGIGRFFRSPVK
ncbi:VTT domain-containing protein [Echinicola soli]|uniref:TVP38/TMEM64 family membrane protein n=1 Tax=Echinicola soli TaxID=2591634 RepID=A0A514CHQ1_9BACT|nr:VTT domain-containing protein [Echinicola soli]QDH79326.1 VTT domain-containing protein [Echinicola soli]